MIGKCGSTACSLPRFCGFIGQMSFLCFDGCIGIVWESCFATLEARHFVRLIYMTSIGIPRRYHHMPSPFYNELGKMDYSLCLSRKGRVFGEQFVRDLRRIPTMSTVIATLFSDMCWLGSNWLASPNEER